MFILFSSGAGSETWF